MLWSLRRPTDADLQAFLASQAEYGFNYPDVGATAVGRAPAGYDHDHNRILLGQGDAVFQAACAALRRWQQFPHSWTRIYSDGETMETGTTVAVLIRTFGIWRLNAARIVYVVDGGASVRRFGFAYGTLPGHVERGEERFVVECDANGEVWYDLRAFSSPRSWALRLGRPIVRRLQRRFVLDSQQSMLAAVAR